MRTEAAGLAKVLLDEVGLKCFIKTSGGKGYHIVIPLTRRQGWDEVKSFSQASARHMAKVFPDRFSAALGPKNRFGKIFIDSLRNSKGASTVAAFSARARPGMGVSMPIAWEELRDIKAADQWIHSLGAQASAHTGCRSMARLLAMQTGSDDRNATSDRIEIAAHIIGGSEMDVGIERRALLLYLGDILEACACVMKCALRFNTVGEAVAQEESLMSFAILRMVDPEITPYEFAKRAASAFFLWPKALLEEVLNRPLLANLVQHDLFIGHQSGWDSYVSELRQQVSWFGERLETVPEPDLEASATTWPPVTE